VSIRGIVRWGWSQQPQAKSFLMITTVQVP
jgi:hypothetical protein